MDHDTAEIYTRCKLALLTGWTFEQIDSAGYLETEALLQINEAQIALMRVK